MKFIAKSEEELGKIAQEIIQAVGERKLLAFKGEMGVGKTTFISYLSKELGVVESISSPTYGYLNEYESKKEGLIYHFDLYRINTEEDAYDIGIEEYIYSNLWVFIEWAENIENLLPENCVWIHISKNSLGERIFEVI